MKAEEALEIANNKEIVNKVKEIKAYNAIILKIREAAENGNKEVFIGYISDFNQMILKKDGYTILLEPSGGYGTVMGYCLYWDNPTMI